MLAGRSALEAMWIRAQVPNCLPAPGIEVFLDLLVDEMVEIEPEDIAEGDKLICLHLSVSVKGLPKGLVLDTSPSCQLGDVLAMLRADFVNPYRY